MSRLDDVGCGGFIFIKGFLVRVMVDDGVILAYMCDVLLVHIYNIYEVRFIIISGGQRKEIFKEKKYTKKENGFNNIHPMASRHRRHP